MNHINYSVTSSLIADYERSVFSAGYFSHFMSARTIITVLDYQARGPKALWDHFLFFFLFFFS